MKLAIINLDTGEIVRSFTGKTYDTIRQQRQYLEKYNAKLMDNNCRDFIWILYDVSQELYPNIQPQDITRLMYIVTYLGYEGYLVYDNHISMNKKGVYNKLNISRQQCDRFYQTMIDNNIFIEQNNKIYINQECFSRGRIYQAIKYKKDIIKLYTNTVRNIYEKIPVQSHKHFGYIFKILPFVNQQYNIVCKNPQEQKYSEIEPLSLDELCDIIHYTSKQRNKIIKELKTDFNINGQPLVRHIIHKTMYKNGNTKMLFINPKIYHVGDKWKKLSFWGQKVEFSAE